MCRLRVRTTLWASVCVSRERLTSLRTFQTVDRPLLKFLECNFGRRWQYVEVQTVLVGLFLKFRFGELLLLVVEICAALGINSGVIVTDHGCMSVSIDVWCWMRGAGCTQC